MRTETFEAISIDGLEPICAFLKERSADCPTILFNGLMGSGKTTLIKSLCKALGSADRISSPTFSLVNEYLDQNGASIYHFDLYRVERQEELLDMGFEEYLDSGSICLIEWPEIAEGLLPTEVITVSIEENNGRRRISVQS